MITSEVNRGGDRGSWIGAKRCPGSCTTKRKRPMPAPLAAELLALSSSGEDELHRAALAANVFYDGRDNVIKSVAPGGLVTKTAYDGARRPTFATSIHFPSTLTLTTSAVKSVTVEPLLLNNDEPTA